MEDALEANLALNSGCLQILDRSGNGRTGSVVPSQVSDSERIRSNMRPLGPATSDSSITVPGWYSVSKYTNRPFSPTSPLITVLIQTRQVGVVVARPVRHMLQPGAPGLQKVAVHRRHVVARLDQLDLHVA